MRFARLTLALLFASTSALPALSQSSPEPYFRLGLGSGAVVPGGPTTPEEPTTPPAAASLSYASQSTGLNQTVTASPILPSGVSATLYMKASGSTEADIDPSTGVITWTPVLHAGPQIVRVALFTKPNPDPNNDSPDAIGEFVLDVDADYSVTMSPPSLSIALGHETPEAPITFTATLGNGAPPNAWSAIVTNFPTWWPDVASATETTLTIDPAAMAYRLMNSGTYTVQAQVYDQDDPDWPSVSSNVATVSVTGVPYFEWANNASAPTYRVFDSIVFVKRGEAVNIAPQGFSGAVSAPTSWPDWVDDAMADNSSFTTDLPDGLSFASNGSITGSTMEADNVQHDVMLPTRSGDNRYGLSFLGIVPVDTLPTSNPFTPTDPVPDVDTDGDGVPDDEDPWPNNPDLPGNPIDDYDGDGIPNGDDAYPDDATRWGTVRPVWFLVRVPVAVDEDGNAVAPVKIGGGHATMPDAYDGWWYKYDDGTLCNDGRVVPQYGLDWYGAPLAWPC